MVVLIFYHVAQGKNTNNAVVSSRKYKGLRGFCPRKFKIVDNRTKNALKFSTRFVDNL